MAYRYRGEGGSYKYGSNLTKKHGAYEGLFDTIEKYKGKKVMLDETLGTVKDKSTGAERQETYIEMLQRNYKRLAKMADQRLVRLEQAEAKDSKYKNIKDFAYRRAMEDLKMFATEPGEEVTRYNRAMPKNARALTAKINSMLTFLNSVTSTKSGIDKVYRSRADTINSKYGTNLTWEDMYYWFAEVGIKKEYKKYVSSEVLVLIGTFRRNPKEVLDEILKAKGKYGLTEDEVKNIDDYDVKKLYEFRDKESLTNDDILEILDLADKEDKTSDALKLYATKKTPKQED